LNKINGFKNKMKIGIDIDEVLADLMNPLVNFYNEKYGTFFRRDDFKAYNLWETWGGTKEETFQTIHDFYDSDSFKKEIYPISGSSNGINFLSNGKNELFIITSRTENVKRHTISWLDDNFSEKFSEIYFTNNGTKKSDVCIDLDIEIMVEDSLEYSIDCVDKGIEVLLMDCPWNKFNGNRISESIKEKITRVSGWNDVLKEIKKRGIC